MSRFSVDVDGLDELLEALEAAPEEIRREGQIIVQDVTNACAREVDGDMPVGKTGNLKARRRIAFPAGVYLVGIIVWFAPHAHLLFGTRERRNRAGAFRGAMPARDPKIVAPIAQAWRRVMFSRLRAMIRSKGWEV